MGLELWSDRSQIDPASHRWVQGVDDQPNSDADGDRSGEVRFASAAFGRSIRRDTLVSDFYARIDAREIALDAFAETGDELGRVGPEQPVGQSRGPACAGTFVALSLQPADALMTRMTD